MTVLRYRPGSTKRSVSGTTSPNAIGTEQVLAAVPAYPAGTTQATLAKDVGGALGAMAGIGSNEGTALGVSLAWRFRREPPRWRWRSPPSSRGVSMSNVREFGSRFADVDG